MPKLISLGSFNTLYRKIKSVLEEARNKTYRAVNFIMVEAYWSIGHLIVENEQKGERRADYGEKLIEKISENLTRDFGKGYSPQSLWNMRQFYLAFPIFSTSQRELRVSKEKLSALRRELTWTHYKLLMRIENPVVRHWYMNESADCNWSTRQLERQINSFYYEQLLSSKQKAIVKKEAANLAKQLKSSSADIIKDPYIFEFLGLKENRRYLESDLENAIIDKLQTFLLELGKGFYFVARQQRISTETQNFFIDLVFYNYILNCFMLIDLKIGKLTHQDIGQMDMYVRIYEDKIKPKEANPTIGLILCSDKDETMVRYSVLKDSKHLFASKYKLYLPTEKELQQEIKKDREIIEIQRKLEVKK